MGKCLKRIVLIGTEEGSPAKCESRPCEEEEEAPRDALPPLCSLQRRFCRMARGLEMISPVRGRPRKLKSTEPEKAEKQEMCCKARNPNCGLEIGESLTFGAVGIMPCDICCSEPHFCRECLCILCGKTMKCGYSAYASVRCFARLSGAEFCGHAAHLMCALDCQMAGVVKQLGLDMEYVCRRCDQKTDLREHVVRLLDSLRYTNCKISAEMNLSTALLIMQGTQADGAKRLLQLVETAIHMMQKGSGIREVFDLLHGTDAEVLLD